MRNDNEVTFEMVDGTEVTVEVDVDEVGDGWWDDLEERLDDGTWFRFTTGPTVYFFRRDQMRSVIY